MRIILNKAIIRYELALIKIYRGIAYDYKNYLIEHGRWGDLRELDIATAEQATGSILADIKWKPD